MKRLNFFLYREQIASKDQLEVTQKADDSKASEIDQLKRDLIKAEAHKIETTAIEYWKKIYMSLIHI